MSKILKNQTVSPIVINDTGVTLPASPATYIIPPEDYLTWAASSDIIVHIGSGDVIVSDGSSDLSPSDGMELIDGIWNKMFVEFEGVQNHLFANAVTTPGTPQSLISYLVPAGKELRVHGVRVSCTRRGVFSIMEDASQIDEGRTGASSLNSSIVYRKQRHVSAGVTFYVDYSAPSDEPATNIAAFVDAALIDV